MGLIAEFKEFAMRGNVIDMAVGIVIGAAFGDVVGSLVKDVLMPPIGAAMAGVDFSQLSFKIPTTLSAIGIGSQPTADAHFVEIKYGILINTIIKFIIVAIALFLVIKAVNKLKRKAPPPAAAPPAPSEIYLKEIRDILAKNPNTAAPR